MLVQFPGFWIVWNEDILSYDDVDDDDDDYDDADDDDDNDDYNHDYDQDNCDKAKCFT